MAERFVACTVLGTQCGMQTYVPLRCYYACMQFAAVHAGMRTDVTHAMGILNLSFVMTSAGDTCGMASGISHTLHAGPQYHASMIWSVEGLFLLSFHQSCFFHSLSTVTNLFCSFKPRGPPHRTGCASCVRESVNQPTSNGSTDVTKAMPKGYFMCVY